MLKLCFSNIHRDESRPSLESGSLGLERQMTNCSRAFTKSSGCLSSRTRLSFIIYMYDNWESGSTQYGTIPSNYSNREPSADEPHVCTDICFSTLKPRLASWLLAMLRSGCLRLEYRASLKLCFVLLPCCTSIMTFGHTS